MVTKPKAPPEESSEEVEAPDEEKYVTKGELHEAITETLKSFFGGELPDGADVDGALDDDKSKDAVGVFSIRDFEAAVERAVANISKSLTAQVTPEEKAKVDEAKDKKTAREEKPAAINVASFLAKAKTYLWGTE